MTEIILVSVEKNWTTPTLLTKETQEECEHFQKQVHTAHMGAQAAWYWTANHANITDPYYTVSIAFCEAAQLSGSHGDEIIEDSKSPYSPENNSK